jgi:hypothetical protein
MRRGTVQSFSALSNITSPGTYTRILSNESNATFGFYADAGVTLAIDNVSLKTYTASSAESWAIVESTLDIRGITGSNESAYATTWYDQSAAAEQPLLVRAGVTNVVNGKAALDFDGVDDYLSLGSTSLSTARQDFFLVMKTSDNEFMVLSQDDTNPYFAWYAREFVTLVGINANYGSPTLFTNGEQRSPAVLKDVWAVLSTGSQVLATSIGGDASSWTDTRFFGYQKLDGDVQELIVYPSDQSANRYNIERSINRFYSIYYDSNTPLVGGQNAPTSTAAYSLRALDGYTDRTNVVRLRRASDHAESDFTAAELTGSVTGSELMPDPNFSDTANWLKGVGWFVAGNQAICDGTQTGLSKVTDVISVLPVNGDIGIITITIDVCSDFNNAGIVFAVGSIQPFVSMGITSPGTYTLSFEWLGGVSACGFGANAGVTMIASQVSYKPYTESAAEVWASNGQVRSRSQTTHSAYATTWYDQSGSGNDATQATAAAQPLLIRAGVTNVVNGKAALDFDGTDDYLEATGATTADGSDDATVFVGKLNTTASQGAFIDNISGSAHFIGSRPAGTPTNFGAFFGTSTDIDYASVDTSQHLHFVHHSSTSASSYGSLDGVVGSLDAGTQGYTSGVRIGKLRDALGATLDGSLQELIIYPSDQSASRTNIETNINNYYSIY